MHADEHALIHSASHTHTHTYTFLTLRTIPAREQLRATAELREK